MSRAELMCSDVDMYVWRMGRQRLKTTQFYTTSLTPSLFTHDKSEKVSYLSIDYSGVTSVDLLEGLEMDEYFTYKNSEDARFCRLIVSNSL
jgi:hypothetical protein